METINTPYDDAFRTLLQDCPELVIPLINELFGTDYTGQEVVLSRSSSINSAALDGGTSLPSRNA